MGTKACTTPLKCSSLLIKREVSSIFSITVKSKKIQFYLWKPKNNVPVVLKLVLRYMETINKCVWTGMATMEMDSELRTSNNIFRLSALVHVPQIKSLKTNVDLFFFLLKIPLIAPLVV